MIVLMEEVATKRLLKFEVQKLLLPKNGDTAKHDNSNKWNNLPNIIKECETLTAFKNNYHVLKNNGLF